MYGCESWTIKKAESQSIDISELWYWRRLESLLDWKEIKPSILREINPEYSLEGHTLKLKFQYFSHLMQRADSLGKKKTNWFWERLRAGGEGDDRGWYGWMASRIQWTWVWASIKRWWRTGKPGVLQSTGLQRVGCDWASEQHRVILVVTWRMVLTFIASVPFHVRVCS